MLPRNAGIGLSLTTTIKERNYQEEKNMYGRIYPEHMEESSKGILLDQNKKKQRNNEADINFPPLQSQTTKHSLIPSWPGLSQ